jgi:hypothetical protein
MVHSSTYRKSQQSPPSMIVFDRFNVILGLFDT